MLPLLLHCGPGAAGGQLRTQGRLQHAMVTSLSAGLQVYLQTFHVQMLALLFNIPVLGSPQSRRGSTHLCHLQLDCFHLQLLDLFDPEMATSERLRAAEMLYARCSNPLHFWERAVPLLPPLQVCFLDYCLSAGLK